MQLCIFEWAPLKKKKHHTIPNQRGCWKTSWKVSWTWGCWLGLNLIGWGHGWFRGRKFGSDGFHCLALLLFVNHVLYVSLCVLAGSHVISCCSLNNIWYIPTRLYNICTLYTFIQCVLYNIYIDNTFGTLLWTCKCNPCSTIFSYVGASTFPPLHFGFRSLSTKDLSDSALRRGKLSGIKDWDAIQGGSWHHLYMKLCIFISIHRTPAHGAINR